MGSKGNMLPIIAISWLSILVIAACAVITWVLTLEIIERCFPKLHCFLWGHSFGGAGWNNHAFGEKEGISEDIIRHYWSCSICKLKIEHDQYYKETSKEPNKRTPYWE